MNRKDASCALVVASCDSFSDVWDAYFTLLFRYWPDCPYTIYLITDSKVYNHPKVKTIVQDELKKDWSSCVIDSLKKIPEKYIIFNQEDFLINGPVKTEHIKKLVKNISEYNAACIRLLPSPPPDKKYNDHLGEITKGPQYSFSLQATIWEKDIFCSLLKKGEQIRHTETTASVRAKNTVQKPFLSVFKNERPFPYFATAIKKGVWYYDAIQLCKKEGIGIKTNKPIESFRHYVVRKLHAERFIRLAKKIQKLGKTYYKKSYSQQGEDIIVESALKQLGKKDMIYLDIGAHHPFYLSNTYYFYKQGHKGVCVEPDTKLCKLIQKKRPKDVCLAVGIGEKDASVQRFYKMNPPSLNTFSKEEAESLEQYGHTIESVHEIKIMNINTIFEKYFSRTPDFVSIDTEGLDLEILKSINFTKYRPSVFCIETKEYKTDSRDESIITFMKSNGYEVYADTHLNTIFYNKKI
jgi:FkbM family methyltransferase